MPVKILLTIVKDELHFLLHFLGACSMSKVAGLHVRATLEEFALK
jgi:hypothetical protein